MNFIIHVLNIHRDSLGLSLIGKHLSLNGIKIIYCNDHDILKKIEIYKPVGTLLPWSTSPFFKNITIKALRYGKVFNYHPEYNHEKSYFIQSNKKFRNRISKVFCMGSNDYNFFLKHNLYEKQQLKIVGKLDHDVLFYLKDRITYSKKKIGWILQGDLINHKDRTLIYHLEKVAYKNFIKKKTSTDNVIYDFFHSLYDVYYNFKFLNYIKSTIKVVVRPHPWENLSVYRKKDFNLNRKKNLLLEPELEEIYKWISTKSKIVHTASTVSADAFILGIPTISLIGMDYPQIIKNLLKANTKSHLKYVRYQWMPKNIEELNKLLIKKNMYVCPKKNYQKYFNELNKIFYLKKKIPTFYNIAVEILNDLKSIKKRKDETKNNFYNLIYRNRLDNKFKYYQNISEKLYYNIIKKNNL